MSCVDAANVAVAAAALILPAATMAFAVLVASIAFTRTATRALGAEDRPLPPPLLLLQGLLVMMCQRCAAVVAK